MTAELEAVVVAAGVFADDTGPCTARPLRSTVGVVFDGSRESQTWRDGAWPYTRR